MKKVVHAITKGLQRLGGADAEVLEQTPSESRRVAALGGIVLTTGAMATAAFAMAAHDWLHLATPSPSSSASAGGSRSSTWTGGCS